jgi:peptide deformylase
MAIRNILQFPDPRLRKIAEPVGVVNTAIRQLVNDMAETMYNAPGIGLAATQIDVHKRVITIDISPDRSDLLVLINPEILTGDGKQVLEEGCLSVPGIYEKVTRFEKIRVRALDRHGQSFELDADELLAVCIQHEIDHLDGKVFVDYLSPLKQQRIDKKLQKQQRMAL